MIPRHRFSALILVLFAAVLHAQSDPGVKDPSKFDPKRPLAQELTTNVPDGFRLVAVGDCIISRPLSQYASRKPAVAAVLKKLKEGDATYGNLETSIIDIRSFKGSPYTGEDDEPLLALPPVAKDLAAMGFDLMSRANNHALDWGIEGMRETTKWADDAGLVTAGVGEDQARPGPHTTTKARKAASGSSRWLPLSAPPRKRCLRREARRVGRD